MKYEYTEDTINIAKFMGIEPIKRVDENTSNIYYCYNNYEAQDIEALPLYNEWNELMPVVIKIEKLGGDDNEFDIFGNCVQLGDEEFVGVDKMEAVWKAVVWWISNNYIK